MNDVLYCVCLFVGLCVKADSDRNPCNDQFMGDRAHSEPEVQSVVQFLTSRAEQFVGFVTFHSYGQRIMTRWDYTSDEVPLDHNDLVRAVFHVGFKLQTALSVDERSLVFLQHSYKANERKSTVKLGLK